MQEFQTLITYNGKPANFGLVNNTGLVQRISAIIGKIGAPTIRGCPSSVEVRLQVESMLRVFVKANEDKFRDLPGCTYSQQQGSHSIRGTAGLRPLGTWTSPQNLGPYGVGRY